MPHSKASRTRRVPSAISKREANKIDKVNRIKQAANELFSTRGYDETTMREIAAKSKVALGTLFLYASNKRDLLFLIANEAMEDTRARASTLVDEKSSIIENLLAVCIVHFERYGNQADIFRLVLRELLFYDSGEQAVRATRNRSQLLRLFTDIVEAAARRGEIHLTHKAELVGWIFFSVLQAEIRRWIALERRDLSEGIAHLWMSMSLVLNGLVRKPVVAIATKSDIKRIMARAISPPNSTRS